jgi:hypothetical protein
MQSARASDNVDLAAMYAPSVMVAGPAGARIVTAAEMLQAIGKRKQLFQSAGHQRTTLVGFEARDLSDRYALVHAEWRWEFQGAGDVPTAVELPSTFLVDRSGDAPKILLYLMHHDIGEVLRGRGLLPTPA